MSHFLSPRLRTTLGTTCGQQRPVSYSEVVGRVAGNLSPTLSTYLALHLHLPLPSRSADTTTRSSRSKSAKNSPLDSVVISCGRGSKGRRGCVGFILPP